VKGNITATGSLGFSTGRSQMINLYNTSYGIGIQNYTQYFRTGSNFAWYKGGVYSDAALDPGSGGAAQMVLLENGHLGLGTTDPISKLHVSGDARFSNSSSDYLKLGSGSNSFIDSYGAGNLDFRNNGLTNMTLSNSGKLGLNTTNPSEKLHVNGNIMTNGNIIATGSLDFSTPTTSQMINLWDTSHGIGVQNKTHYVRTDHNFAWYKGGVHSNAVLDPGSGGAAQMVLLENGNLGVGTSTPSEKLDVKGNIKATGTLDFSTPTTSQMINLWDTSHGIGVQNKTHYVRTDHNFAWYKGGVHSNAVLDPGSGGAAQMVLLENGNLGVGTSTPSETLEVNGNVKVNSKIYFGTSSIHQDQGGAIELGGNGKTPYIDFKNDNALDYSSRIVLNGEGNLQVTGGIVETTGLNLTGDGANTNTIDSNINGTIVFGGEDGSTLTDTQIAESFYPNFAVWVEEGIVTEDIVIATTNQWSETHPDYVFEADYKLPELMDVEAYIKENGHLEDIPSKAEVEEKGWSLPNMDQKLLKKVEELTLYTIEQQYEIEHLKQQLSQLETLEVEIKLIKQAIQNGNHK
jgi:lipopolysaccharide export system protein LptC